MRNRLPPLQWLRAFEAAARHLSFTAAGSEIGITQSAVSQQIKALEQYLGQALFLRRARSLELTEAGRHYLPTVREAFGILIEGTDVFRGFDPERFVEVKANTAFSVLWLAPRLHLFHARHPDVQINLSTAMWEADFSGGQGTVEVRYGRGEWTGGSSELLARTTVFPVAAPEIAARIRSPDDLSKETWLCIAGGAGYDWEPWLEAVGKPQLEGRRSHYFNTYVLTLELARRGEGVAIAHGLLAQDLLTEGRLQRPFAEEVPIREGYYLTSLRHGELSQAAQSFCDWIRSCFRC